MLAFLVMMGSFLGFGFFLWPILAAVNLAVEEFNACPHGLYCCCGIFSWICFILYYDCSGMYYSLVVVRSCLTFTVVLMTHEDCPFRILFLPRLGVCAPVVAL